MPCLVVVVFSAACARPTPDAPPAPPTVAVAPACVDDIVDHATTLLGARAPAGGAVEGPLESGVEPTPVDLDGDGRPERAVTFEDLMGAYSRPLWVYASNGGCTRFVGEFDEMYVWPGTQRHAGMLDLLALQPGAESETVVDGGGTMVRLVFDGERYAQDGSVACPAVDREALRDARCPGPWGVPGPWSQARAWDDGASLQLTNACLFPASDASVAFGGEATSQLELPDLDRDGAADVAFASEAFGGSGGYELQVYVSNHGCPRTVGRISVAGEPTWDAEAKELRGGWTEGTAGSCEPGEVASVQVFYRLEESALVEARRVECNCGDQRPDCS